MTQELILVNERIAGVILGWRAEHRIASVKTDETYAPMLEAFRAFLWGHALDLDAPSQKIRYHLQAWAAAKHLKTGKPVTPATHNLRISAVSSFFDYAIRNEEMAGPNPLDPVKRLKRERYKGAKAMPFEDGEMDEAIAAIPTDTLNGMRDRALLSVTLYTGRRLSEIADLKCGAVRFTPAGMEIEWVQVKGGDSARNVLPKHCPAVEHMRRWMKRYYGANPVADNLVFPSLSRNHEGGRMTARGIEQRAARWLPTSGKFHALRHTFAMSFITSGGTVAELSQALGHKNLATTSAYVDKMTSGVNTHIDDMISVYAGKGRHKK